jgi:antirestriction protein ArdC
MTKTVLIAGKFQNGAGLSGYVAEMNAAFCCASLGIVPTVRHADYIGSWLEVLREDNRAIVRAASQASKAADWLLSHLPDEDAWEPVPAAIEGRVAA